MKAKKDNKVYRITEDNKNRYLNEGYDIYNDIGEVIEYSPKKKVPYGDYVRAVKEIESLRARIKELDAQEPSAEMVTEKSAEKKTGKKAEG